jgi:hypothetical protein
MQLSSLLGCPVRDADDRRLGTVVDVRLRVSGDLDDRPAEPELHGLIVSPRTQSSYLGYERSDARGPALLAAILTWRHRGTFLALWPDVAQLASGIVTLKTGFTAYSPVLREKS